MGEPNERPRETGCAGLWRDANEKTVVACMESGELAIRDADTGEILSAGQLEQAAPFQRTEWKGIDLTRAGFSAMPDTAGCWSDANGTLWLITGGDGIDGHIFRLKEEGREWECAPCSGITVRMLHEWGPWARCDFEPMDDEGTHFDWCKRGSPIADGRPKSLTTIPGNRPRTARTPGIRSKPSKRSRGSRPPTIPLRFMRGAAPCISRMSDRSVVWNRTSGLP